MPMKKYIDKLAESNGLTKEEWLTLLSQRDAASDRYLFEKSREVQQRFFKNRIYIRGLIEISNYCKNDCYYCGIRKSNGNVCRYRLTKEAILSCCETGASLGFRTFVLQGGEDAYYNDERLCEIVAAIKEGYPHCAVTLSLGERSRKSYEMLFAAGANRYLLRHETANPTHYGKLHPPKLSSEKRKECLKNLKEIGFQTGTGFMVGSPYQTLENLAEDMLYIKELQPQMVGIGPFIAHHETPFATFPDGNVELTLFLIGALRLMLPNVLLPATTALNTIGDHGRERGILAGANVIMPNLSPKEAKEQYTLYDHKLITGVESAEALNELKIQMESIGYEISAERGDFVPMRKTEEKNV